MFTSSKIEVWPPSFTAAGLELFVHVFSIPLYFLASGIPILGIFLTIQRINQTDKQYIALVRQNYQQHYRDFCETILSTCTEEIEYIFKEIKDKNRFLINLHSLCFGNRESFDYLAKDDVYILLDELYNVSFNKSNDKDFIYDIQEYLDMFGFDSDLYFHTFDDADELEYMMSALYIIEMMSQFIGNEEHLDFNKSFEKQFKQLRV